MKEVERQLGIKSQHIYRCCNNKRKSTGGYKWEYGITEDDNATGERVGGFGSTGK